MFDQYVLNVVCEGDASKFDGVLADLRAQVATGASPADVLREIGLGPSPDIVSAITGI